VKPNTSLCLRTGFHGLRANEYRCIVGDDDNEEELMERKSRDSEMMMMMINCCVLNNLFFSPNPSMSISPRFFTQYTNG
jgi:hypothetical protein